MYPSSMQTTWPASDQVQRPVYLQSNIAHSATQALPPTPPFFPPSFKFQVSSSFKGQSHSEPIVVAIRPKFSGSSAEWSLHVFLLCPPPPPLKDTLAFWSIWFPPAHC